MKLSDAIALGRHLVEEPDSGTYCRCAIGMGLAAIGNHFHETGDSFARSGRALEKAEETWPWLRQLVRNLDGDWMTGEHAISVGFIDVEFGRITLDQLIDWVRSVEPAEPEAQAEKCRCGQSFATYDLLLDHIANGERATGPHVSEKVFERMEEDFHDSRAGTR